MTTNVYLAEIAGGKKKIVVRAKKESSNELVECSCPNCGALLRYSSTYPVKKCSYCKLPVEWFIEPWKPQYREGDIGRIGAGR